MPAVATAGGLPSRLGKYELLLPLAAGGMARIYIGRSTGIGSFERHVVLKMITPERANDLTAVNMFLDEARLAASLNHQNVAQVFEVGEDVGIHYLAMEYVHGQDLRAVLAKAGSQGTRIPLELALTVVAGAAAGLHHAHERRGPDGAPLGIVHRDVSPSNIMIGYDGAVKLLDFGIAKATARSVETQSGIIKGKFAYMAPEQCRGREVDRRSDVFSLGIILYEISTQHRCFRADSDFDTMHRIVTGDVVRPTRLVQGYPQALEAIVMKALAIDAAQRYQSSGLLLEALESFAVSSRMSLSTMGLGRFMRDMFGEVQEPWLNTAATKILQPIVAKENTISSTNGQGKAHQLAPERLPPEQLDASGIPEEGAFPDSAKADAAKTLLDLPRGNDQQPQQVADWNAYPGAQPPPLEPSYPLATRQSQPQVPAQRQSNPQVPAQSARQSNPQVPAMMMTPEMMRGTPPSGVQPMPHPPHGTLPPPELPLPPPPQQQFNVPGSGSHPSHPAVGIPSTKLGYTSGAMSRSDVSYPRYDAPLDAMSSPDLQLTPNRRPLFIGLGIVLVGVVVMLFVSFGGNEPTSTAPSETTDEPTEESAPAESAKGSDEDLADDSMVSVTVHSDPSGADVLIAGTKIGVTPFDKKPFKRGTKIAQLTVQKEGYVPYVGKIDMAGDYENPNIKLVRVEDAAKGSATETVPEPSGSAKPEGANPGTDAKPSAKTGTGAAKTSEKTSAEKTGAEKTGAEKAGTAKAGAAKTSTEKTGAEKTGTEKSGTTKTGSEKTGSEKTSTEKASSGGTTPKKEPPKKEEKCQPPGANIDPFGPPVCKT